MMSNGYGYGPYWDPAGGLIHFVWWIIAIIIIVSILRWVFGCRRYRRWGGPWTQGQGSWGRSPWQQNQALDILKERYAKGEIDKTEFDAKKKDLE